MRTTYCNCFDLPLYCAIDQMLAGTGKYRFDTVRKSPGITWDFVLRCADAADMQAVGIQRVLALTIFGTPFSTSALDRVVLLGVRNKDPFFAVALCAACDEDLKMQVLTAFDSEQFSIEESVFLLTAYGGNEVLARHLIFGITEQLKRDIGFIMANPVAAGWLLTFVLGSSSRTVFLEKLAYVVKHIAPDKSSAFTELMNGGYSMLTSLMIVWYVRKYSGAFKLKRKRENELEGRFCSALAHHYKEWSAEQKYAIKKLGGDLGMRIDCSANRAWYKAEFGLRVPEVGLPNTDYESVSSEYTEYEKCVIAQSEGLSAEDVVALGAEFGEWRLQWHWYVQGNGIAAKNVCYNLTGNEALDGLDEEMLAAELQLREEFTEEELPIALEASSKVSAECFMRIAEIYLDVFDELPDSMNEVYESFSDIEYDGLPLLQKCYNAAIDVNSLVGWRKCEAESMLERMGNPDAFIVAVKSACDAGIDVPLSEMAKIFNDGISDVADYFRKEAGLDDTTKKVLKVAQSGKELLEYLSIFECIANLDRAVRVVDSLYVFKDASGIYGAAVWQLLRVWLSGGNVIDVLAEMFKPAKIPEDWLVCWNGIAYKDFTQLTSLGGLTPWNGRIDGIAASLTPQGVLAAGRIRVDRISVPVYCVDPEGEMMEFELMHPIGAAGVPDVLGDLVYYDCKRKYRVVKLN